MSHVSHEDSANFDGREHPAQDCLPSDIPEAFYCKTKYSETFIRFIPRVKPPAWDLRDYRTQGVRWLE